MQASSWKTAFARGLVSGSVASALSTAAIATCSKIEGRRFGSGLNGPSQWLWGEAEAYERRPTLRHTLPGVLIHHAMSVGWAVVYEKTLGAPAPLRTPTARVGSAAATAAMAYCVDYYLTPRRLRPGFEKHLCGASMFAVYASFAAGLAVAKFIVPGRLKSRSDGPSLKPNAQESSGSLQEPARSEAVPAQKTTTRPRP